MDTVLQFGASNLRNVEDIRMFYRHYLWVIAPATSLETWLGVLELDMLRAKKLRNGSDYGQGGLGCAES